MSTLAERILKIRALAGYGDRRQAAEFARLLGISPPSLHNLESGKTLTLGKSLPGLIRLGASLEFLTTGKGEPMQKGEIERKLKDDTLTSMIGELDAADRDMLADVVKGIIRRKRAPSANDPFKKDPPEGDA